MLDLRLSDQLVLYALIFAWFGLVCCSVCCLFKNCLQSRPQAACVDGCKSLVAPKTLFNMGAIAAGTASVGQDTAVAQVRRLGCSDGLGHQTRPVQSSSHSALADHAQMQQPLPSASGPPKQHLVATAKADCSNAQSSLRGVQWTVESGKGIAHTPCILCRNLFR